MSRLKSGSKSLTARDRARNALAEEFATAERRRAVLADVFTAIDAREELDRQLGIKLAEMQKLGESVAALTTHTSLTTREVTGLIKLASDDNNSGTDTASHEPSRNDDTAAVDSSHDNN